jgi:hypothetical protein
MDNQNEKPKNEKPVSRLYLVEKGTWKNDQEVITFYYNNDEGKRKAIGHVYVHYDKEGKATFGSQDAKGNDLFPPCSNRYDLKKQFLDNEQDLIQKFERKQELGQEKNPAQQNPQAVNKPEVQQPENTPEQKQKPARQNRRKNELDEIRQENEDNEKEQSVSR